MDRHAVMGWLEAHGSEKERQALTRYGIPNDRALGISVGDLKRFAKQVGTSHRLAQELWETGWYEARTLAAFIDDPAEVSDRQMESWVHDFDSWAICDTTCFHLFDRTESAWDKVDAWAPAPEEFVRRAAFALVWALSVHDKKADDARFLRALEIVEEMAADDRDYVKKAVDMALRATGKRNRALNAAATAVATRMAESGDGTRAWIGKHALRELTSDKVMARLR